LLPFVTTHFVCHVVDHHSYVAKLFLLALLKHTGKFQNSQGSLGSLFHKIFVFGFPWGGSIGNAKVNLFSF
jgi:hypothetical protein